MLIIKASNDKGALYIETKSLDGETNLKNKNVAKEINQMFADDVMSIKQIDGTISCEQPNNAIYKFEGTYENGGMQVSLSAENVVLRGCKLRNTAHVYGITVFTGHDTKIMMNSAKAQYKFSTLERMSNRAILMVLGTQFTLATIASAIGTSWML